MVGALRQSEVGMTNAEREWAELTKDMYDELTDEIIDSVEARAVVRYFARKIKERFKEE